MSDFTIQPVIWEGDRGVFAKAFVSAQRSMEAVKKASSNEHFKTRYADLSALVEAVVPALNEAGIGEMQFPAFDGEWVHITTMLIHESGSSVSMVLSLRPSKSDPQGVGSAITYGRRYSLLSITGTAPEDDDGNAASGPRQEPLPPKASVAVTAAQTAITMANSRDELKVWRTANSDMLASMPTIEADAIVKSFNERWAALAQLSAPPRENKSSPHQTAIAEISDDEIPDFN